MKLYRGTKISGLKVMKPSLVNHKIPYVYATTDKIEAIIYSVKGGNFNYTNVYGYDDNNNRCLIERKENSLETIYDTKGRYYILDDLTFEKHKELGVGDNEYVSTVSVNVIEEVEISNVWIYLKELERNGFLKIYRYPARPKTYPSDDEDLIECATIMYLQTNDIVESFNILLYYHPELKDRIEVKKKELIGMDKGDIKKSLKYFK